MKRLIFALLLAVILAGTTAAQVKSVAAANQPVSTAIAPFATPRSATRARIIGTTTTSTPAGGRSGDAQSFQAHAGSDLNQHSRAARFRRATEPTEKGASVAPPSVKEVGPVMQKSNSPSSGAVASAAHASGVNNANTPVNATQLYRVGLRDVLDIQLADNQNSNSTLFTVLDNGRIDYPFAGDPVAVAGLTTAEIAMLLRQRIKIFDKPTVVVNVRDFASHTVTVSGFVAAPGTKTLRREAIPLYAILAESLVLPEATRATIIHPGRAPFVVDLKNANVSATLVVPGDAIKVSGASSGPAEFFFIGGEINSPGQKSFSYGLTLTQAILASGGTRTSGAATVRVSRQVADGRLVSAQYSLVDIQAGKSPDPEILKGDRIEVSSAR
jgi:protein involved in polysaccharide export with SLBB domain